MKIYLFKDQTEKRTQIRVYVVGFSELATCSVTAVALVSVGQDGKEECEVK